MSEFVTFLTGDYKILQDDAGYLFSADSVLLSNLASIGSADSVIDLGSGCGVLSTLAVIKKNAARAVGVEIDINSVEMANKSAKMNKLDDRLAFVCGDVRDIKNLVVAGSFDKALLNPPYFPTTDGNSQTGARAVARKNVEGSLSDFVKAAAYALKNGGDLFVVYKFERITDLLFELRSHGLEPKKAVLVYPKLSKGVDTVIVSAKKGGKCGLTAETLVLMDEEGKYTPEVKELYK